MSRHSSGKLSPSDLKDFVPCAEWEPKEVKHPPRYEEAMEVDHAGINSNIAFQESRDVIRSPNIESLNQDERLRAWFNTMGRTPPGGTSEPTEDPMEACDDDDNEACAKGVVEARIENVQRFRQPSHKNDQRIYEGCTMIRCLPWKILAIFHPNELGPTFAKHMGLFVQCNDENKSQTWSCSAKATLMIVAQQPNCEDKMLTIQHTFTSKEVDWGFQTFISYDDLFDPSRGFIADDGSILLRVHVRADAPHGVDWDSKRHTGFVGLKNQGATCYLNSLLQALYCTNKLRRAVFLMPTESDNTQNSVPLALQRVFFELQHSDRAVGTKKLTRSFGWATLDSFLQHDAQELCRVLLDNLENKMKGTSVEDVIPGLFCGKMLSYIRCINVSYESKREENFYDIQLKVNGNQSVNDAFIEYIAKETLSGDNKYDAGEYGLQEAEKGVIFTRFPPVLYLQLMRFQYDFAADTNVKINDRFEFTYKLELDRFLLQPDADAPANYFLHAVLVHSGDNHGGHYVVYINPAGNGIWYQFDDDVVSRCSARDAIYMNFGGSEDPDMRPCTNAYMLVYIAESARDEVLCSVLTDDIPESLRDRFKEEQHLEETKRLEKERGHLFMVVYLILEEDFYGWQGAELCNVDQLPHRMLRVHKQTTRLQLIDSLANVLNRPSDSIQLWHLRPRRKTIPTHLSEVNDNPLQYPPKDALVFFVQFCEPSVVPSSPPPSPAFSSLITVQPAHHQEGNITADRRLFFLKHFDPSTWSMSFCGQVELGADECLSALEPIARTRANIPPDSDVIFFQDDPKTNVSAVIQTEVPIAKLFKREYQGLLIYFQVITHKSVDVPIEDVSLTESDNITDKVCSPSSVKGATSGQTVEIVNGVLVPSSDVDLTAASDCTIGGKPSSLLSTLDPITLRKMAVLPNFQNADPAFASVATNDLPTDVTDAQHAIYNYFANSLLMVDILLVDTMRPSDPGILLQVSTTLTYWDFAKLAAAVLSTQSDHLQFFRSQQAIGGSTAPISVSPAATTGVMGSEINTSPIVSDLGGGINCNTAASGEMGGNSHIFASDPSLTPLAAAAKAAGFPYSSAYMNNLIASAASQGLFHEPPGAAILSTHSGTLKEFLLPFNVSPTNSSWASDVGNIGSAMAGTGGGGPITGGAGALPTPDRFPVPLNRYCGLKTVNRSPFGQGSFSPPRRVYYAHLALRIDELETMRQVRVCFVGPKLTKVELVLSVPQNGLVVDLLKEASRHLVLQPDGSGQLRLMEISANRIIQEYPPTFKLSTISQSIAFPQTTSCSHCLRIEEVPVDELSLRSDEVVVYVSHFDKEVHDTFGVPFTIRVCHGESYNLVRERIRRRLEVPEKEFERWRFAIVLPNQATYIPNDADLIVDTSKFVQPDAPERRTWLGLEHKPSKRPRYAPNEKPIKIHN